MTGTRALVLVGHGSQHHPDSSAPLHSHADRVRASGQFHEVRTAFWKEEPGLHEVRSIVESDVAYVVPVLTSKGYFADEVFPRELGIGDDTDGRTGEPELRYTDPVGTHESIVDVVKARVESVREGPASTVGVALVGHGTERNERSARATRRHARRLRDRGRYADAVALFLDEAPHVGGVYDRLDADELVVVPLFVADGYHTTRDVPRAIDHPGMGETATVDGRTVHYTGAIGSEPALADVIIQRAVEAGAPSGRLTEASDTSDGRVGSFLVWVDAASPRAGRAWGQLRIIASGREYEVRHRCDADSDRSALDTLEDSAALRKRVRTDDRGRYRPLTGERTLPRGWMLATRDADELARAVESVYPGSIAHWYAERDADLDVTHFGETAARQTGIYADLADLDRRELSATVEAVCGNCVRRRCWEVAEREPIDASPGDGKILCREACPFFLSAAHTLADEPVEVAPTPDQDVPTGAFGDPSNRYLVRYARALAARGERGSRPIGVGGDS